jgi:hypothetical protein
MMTAGITEATMKHSPTRSIAKHTLQKLVTRQMIRARRSYPTVSLVRLQRSPLERLVWFFGIGR